MHKTGYCIVMFAYNEEGNIEASVRSVLANISNDLLSFTIIINGSKDNTAGIVRALIESGESSKLNMVELELGDKCNAWNKYIHDLSIDCDMHFFLDADVEFTPNAFPKMYQTLMNDKYANAIAGLPFSGRNIKRYKQMVKSGHCLFGNCYGLSHSFVQLIKKEQFNLPIGLGWIDSAITKIVNRDIEDIPNPKKGKIICNEECGYTFKSLSPFIFKDVELYINRIIRYKLGKLQEKHLEKIPFKQWPRLLDNINKKVLEDIESYGHWYNFLETKLISKRIKKQALKMSTITFKES